MRRFVGKKGMLSEQYVFDLTEKGPNVYEFLIYHLPTRDKYMYVVHGVNWAAINYKFTEVS